MNYSINAPYECKTPIFLAKKSSAFSEINDWALRYRTSSANCQMYVPLLKNIFLVSEIGWHQPAVQAGSTKVCYIPTITHMVFDIY